MNGGRRIRDGVDWRSRATRVVGTPVSVLKDDGGPRAESARLSLSKCVLQGRLGGVRY